MSQVSKVSDSVRNMFSTIVSTDHTDFEVMLLVLQNLDVKLEIFSKEIIQKLDHTLALQQKTPSGKGTKKTKTSTTPGNTYFLNSYVDNPEQFAEILNQEEVDKTLNEFEDILKDHEGEELKNKQAEVLWTNFITKFPELVEHFDKLAKENPDSVAAPTTKKSTTKKATKVAADKSEAKEKAPKAVKGKKAKDAETEADAEEKPAAKKPKGKGKKAKDAEPEAEEEEEKKPAKKASKGKKPKEPEPEPETEEEEEKKPAKKASKSKKPKEPEPESEEDDTEEDDDDQEVEEVPNKADAKKSKK